MTVCIIGIWDISKLRGMGYQNLFWDIEKSNFGIWDILRNLFMSTGIPPIKALFL